MPLKITKITIKLIRLANNNPNENEAIAAARKACAMIGEALDAMEAAKNPPPPPPSSQSPYSGFYNATWHTSPFEQDDFLYNWMRQRAAQQRREQDKARREKEQEEARREATEKQQRDRGFEVTCMRCALTYHAYNEILKEATLRCPRCGYR